MSTDRKQMLAAQFAALSLFALIIVTAACNQSQAQRIPPSPTPEPIPALPSEVEVVQKEFSLEPSTPTVMAGEVTFIIKNEGFIEHNFVIEGIDDKVELVLPQESETLTVDMPPGDYRLVCNIQGHEEAGMVSEITVQ